jgi:hypothetical protein
MNLPDAPIAHEGFFVTHFFTVRDQDLCSTLFNLVDSRKAMTSH